MEAVHRYEGTVNQVMGDGIMALFGAPLAHEDHAVRACYAALRMQESVKRYAEDVRRQHGIEVQIRVGVNSGEVVVRAIGSDLHVDYTAVGQTTHLAARMEQLAAPGTVRLTAETLRLAEGYVEVKVRSDRHPGLESCGTTLPGPLGEFGRFAEAFGHLREAMRIAEEAGHVYSLVQPLLRLGTLTLDQGDFAGAVAPLERGLDLCRTREVPVLLHDFAGALGAAYHGTGRRAEGVALMEDAARGVAARDDRLSRWAGRIGSLGGAYLFDGRLADAARIAQDGLLAARQRRERGVEGKLLLLLGDIAAHPDRVDAETAEAHYRQALALAEELGMRPLVAHCHLGLGKLSRQTGKREQAREHLMTATAMYREMGMTHWLETLEKE